MFQDNIDFRSYGEGSGNNELVSLTFERGRSNQGLRCKHPLPLQASTLAVKYIKAP